MFGVSSRTQRHVAETHASQQEIGAEKPSGRTDPGRPGAAQQSQSAPPKPLKALLSCCSQSGRNDFPAVEESVGLSTEEVKVSISC